VRFGILGESRSASGAPRSVCPHPDCYFQVFTNGQLITDDIAQQLARLGNVTPLISIEGSKS
jgi:MoaA/NifB/PqqE/SkfB family radical SAM enzyme